MQKNRVIVIQKEKKPFFSGSQTDPCFQNKNSGCRLTGRLASKLKFMAHFCLWLLYTGDLKLHNPHFITDKYSYLGIFYFSYLHLCFNDRSNPKRKPENQEIYVRVCRNVDHRVNDLSLCSKMGPKSFSSNCVAFELKCMYQLEKKIKAKLIM